MAHLILSWRKAQCTFSCVGWQILTFVDASAEALRERFAGGLASAIAGSARERSRKLLIATCLVARPLLDALTLLGHIALSLVLVNKIDRQLDLHRTTGAAAKVPATTNPTDFSMVTSTAGNSNGTAMIKQVRDFVMDPNAVGPAEEFGVEAGATVFVGELRKDPKMESPSSPGVLQAKLLTATALFSRCLVPPAGGTEADLKSYEQAAGPFVAYLKSRSFFATVEILRATP
jgi:hypothetical protein